MMKSKQLNNTKQAPGHPPGNQLARSQQELIAEVLPQFAEVIIANRFTTGHITEDLKHDIIKRNMKARLKRKLGIQS